MGKDFLGEILKQVQKTKNLDKCDFIKPASVYATKETVIGIKSACKVGENSGILPM